MQKYIEKVYLMITNVCNNKCSYCFQEKKKTIEHIELSSFIDIINKLQKIHIKRLTLSGGEASLHPEFEKILNQLDNYDFEIDLFTNSILDRNTIEQINNSSINKVYISLDGSNDKYNYSRGKATIKTVEKCINSLNKEIVIMNTLNATNYMDVGNFLEYCSGFDNVIKVNFNPIKILHESYSELALTKNMLNDANKEICNFINNNKLKARSYYNCYSDVVMNCSAAKNSIAIDTNGDVSGCIFGSSVDKDIFIVGNIFKENLEDMWKDNNRWKIFDNVSDEQCSQCKNVNKCTHICSIENYLVRKSSNKYEYLCIMR